MSDPFAPAPEWEWERVRPPTGRGRPTLAVFKLASCDGCQLSLLDHEDALLRLADVVQIAEFAELSSASMPGPYDLVLVEGSVTTPADAARVAGIRDAARRLVAIGACATAGGIQSLRNFADEPALARRVYAHPEYLATLADSTPVSAHVRVDAEIHGCPVDGGELLEVVAATLAGRRPITRPHAVCEECKQAGHACLLVTGRAACLGPVTHAGCGALCPGVDRGCFGCFGPSESPNTSSLAAGLARRNISEKSLRRLLRTFTAAAPAFATESARHGDV